MSPNEPVKKLLQDLKQGSYHAQMEALRQLRHYPHPDPEVVEAVIGSLRATNTWPAVRVEAASCLGAFRDPSAVPALLAALDRGPTTRHAVLASLRLLVEPDTLLLLRLTRAKPDVDIRKEAADRVAAFPATVYLHGHRLDPVQRWATAILINLRDHGTPEALPRLITVLEHEKTQSHYHSLLLEALLGIARRHPEMALTPVREAVRRRLLIDVSSGLFQKTLRELDPLAGSNLPIPARPSALPRLELPRPATLTPDAVLPLAAARPDPSAIERVSSPPVWSMLQTLLLELGPIWLVIFLMSSYVSWISGQSASPHGAAFYILLTIFRLLFALRYELPTETIRCDGHQLTVTRRLGPLRWRRKILLPPDGRIQRITQKHTWRFWFRGVSAAPVHLACVSADSRPFRFAHERTPEALDRLAAEINAYLEQQETVAPTPSLLEAEPQRLSEPAIPAQVNGHAP